MCSRTQNAQNRIRRTRHQGYSSYQGVTFDKAKGKFLARISAQGHSHFLGYFKTDIEAAKAYDKAAREFHGEFATTNFSETNKNSENFFQVEKVYSIMDATQGQSFEPLEENLYWNPPDVIEERTQHNVKRNC